MNFCNHSRHWPGNHTRMDLWICHTWQVQSRMSVAELKTLVKRPDVVEVWVTNLVMCFQREKWSTGYLSSLCWLEVWLCSRGHHSIRSTIAGVFEGLHPKLLWNLTDRCKIQTQQMIWLDLLRFGWGGHIICYDVNTLESKLLKSPQAYRNTVAVPRHWSSGKLIPCDLGLWFGSIW